MSFKNAWNLEPHASDCYLNWRAKEEEILLLRKHWDKIAALGLTDDLNALIRIVNQNTERDNWDAGDR